MNTPEYILMDNNLPSKTLSSKNGGEWIEFYTGNAMHGAYIKHHMFWRGTGFMGKHAHKFQNEKILVFSGVACYYINNKCFYAKTGEIINIPPNTPHINPFNASEKPLVLLYLSPSPNLIYFFLRYYNAINATSRHNRTISVLHQQVLINEEFKGHIIFSQPRQLFLKFTFHLLKRFHRKLEKIGILARRHFSLEQPPLLSMHKHDQFYTRATDRQAAYGAKDLF